MGRRVLGASPMLFRRKFWKLFLSSSDVIVHRLCVWNCCTQFSNSLRMELIHGEVQSLDSHSGKWKPVDRLR